MSGDIERTHRLKREREKERERERWGGRKLTD